MTRTEELPSTTNSPHTRTVLSPRTTGKKSIPNKHWNMPIELSSGRRKHMASPSSQRGSHKGVDPKEERQFSSYGESRAGELGGELSVQR